MTRRSLIAGVLAFLAFALAACTPDAVEPLPPAPKVPETTTTTIIDYSDVGLGAVAPGRTTTTVGLGPGRATLSGSVVGPNGPVPGAVVHAERIVGEAVATMDILTLADGTFTIPTILGGRYRVRAWKSAPDNLALLEPVVLFLEGSENKRLELNVRRFQGLSASAAIAPDPPRINEASNLVVQVVDQSVDQAGIVRSQPLPGVRVELFGSGDWRLLSPVATVTDGAGRGRWQLECRRVGDQPLSVVVGETDSFNLNLPDCTVPPPEPPVEGETTAPSDTTPTTAASTPASTTTTRPASSGSTTTTTARPTTSTTAG